MATIELTVKISEETLGADSTIDFDATVQAYSEEIKAEIARYFTSEEIEVTFEIGQYFGSSFIWRSDDRIPDSTIDFIEELVGDVYNRGGFWVE